MINDMNTKNMRLVPLKRLSTAFAMMLITATAWAVDYIDEGGTKQTVEATKLTGNEGAMTNTNISGVCYVEGTVNYAGKIMLTGNTTIILCDGATMNIGTSNSPGNMCSISGNYSLTIYGQREQTGVLNIYTRADQRRYSINLKNNYTQHGGNVNVDNSSGNCFYIDGSDLKITLTRGSLTATSEGNTAIKFTSDSGLIDMSGGTLTATSNYDSAISGNVNLSGGVLKAKGAANGIKGAVTMSGGVLTATGDNSGDFTGIYGAVTLTGGDLTAKGKHGISGNVNMSGGFLTATGTNNKGIEGSVNFTGGNFKATGSSDYAGISGSVTLSWSSCYDSFTANKCTVNIADGKQFLDGGTPVSGNDIAIDGTTTLTPDNRGDIASSTRIDLEVHDDGTGNYWTTFYHPAVGFNISVNENDVPTAYIATVSGSKVELTGIEPRGCVPAGQAVIVKTATYGNGKITLTRSDDIDQPSGTNHLKGGASVTPGLDAYTLSRGDGGTGTLGFYKFSGTSLDPYKAHLEIDPSSPSPSRGFFDIEDDETTAILAPPLIEAGSSVADGEAVWYSLDGRRLSGKPVKKGIYVRNGQKYIVK